MFSRVIIIFKKIKNGLNAFVEMNEQANHLRNKKKESPGINPGASASPKLLQEGLAKVGPIK